MAAPGLTQPPPDLLGPMDGATGEVDSGTDHDQLVCYECRSPILPGEAKVKYGKYDLHSVPWQALASFYIFRCVDPLSLCSAVADPLIPLWF
jgi:hypothetical protein